MRLLKKMISTVYNLVMVVSFAMRCYTTAVPSLYTTCRFNVTELGCPLHGYPDWECLKHEASCPEGTEYHCLRLHGDRSRYAAGCAQSKECSKGEEPYWALVNDGIPIHVICDWCQDIEYFNPDTKLSSTYSHCPERKVKCDYLNVIECLPENKNDVYKQDRLCQCDARNNYVFGDLEILQGKVCTSKLYLATACIHTESCKDGQERLLNYTCANKCKNGFRSDTSDECRPLIEPAETGEPPTAQSRNTKESTTTPRKLFTANVMPQTTTNQIQGDSKCEESYWALVIDGIPIHVECDWCQDIEYYNPKTKLSSTYSRCPERKVKCDYLYGIECVPENRNDVYKQDRLCRCDARQNYIFGDLVRLQGQACTSIPYLAIACIHTEPCKDGQERLLNYTFVNKCKNGFRSDTSDECRPLIEPKETGEPTPTAQSRNTKESTTAPRKLFTDKVMPTLKF